MAPETLPIPPRTAAVNALRPVTKPIRKSIWPKRIPCITPATAARAAPMTKVTTMTRLVSMPMSRAVSGSWAVARMALPGLGGADERLEGHHQGDGVDHHEHRHPRHPHPAHLERPGGDHRGEGLLPVAARVEEPDHLLQEDRHADGGDQRRQPGGVAERPVGQPLDQHRHRHRHQQAATSITGRATHGVARQRVGQQPAVDGEPGEGAHHEDLAVGEVDELDDPVDHRVAEGDEAVGGAQHRAVDQLLEELPHGASRFRAGTGRSLACELAGLQGLPGVVGSTWYMVSSLVTVSPYWSKATLPVAPSKLEAWMASMIARPHRLVDLVLARERLGQGADDGVGRVVGQGAVGRRRVLVAAGLVGVEERLGRREPLGGAPTEVPSRPWPASLALSM